MKYCCLQSIVIPGKPIIRGLEIEMAVEGRLQNYLEKFLPYSLIASALIAGVYGYYTWSFKKTVVTYGMGVFLALVVVVPDWAFFKRHPSEWCIPVASDPQSAAAQKVRFEILNKTPEYAERILRFFEESQVCVLREARVGTEEPMQIWKEALKIELPLETFLKENSSVAVFVFNGESIPGFK